jgi:hypothetical protein
MIYKQEDIKKQQIQDYNFLVGMYEDDYFPNHIVDMGKNLLIKLCLDIEKQQPKTLDTLYNLTHETTERFNDLEAIFYENDSEIETMARECIAEDFEKIALNYGFKDADIEELIEPREW